MKAVQAQPKAIPLEEGGVGVTTGWQHCMEEATDMVQGECSSWEWPEAVRNHVANHPRASDMQDITVRIATWCRAAEIELCSTAGQQGKDRDRYMGRGGPPGFKRVPHHVAPPKDRMLEHVLWWTSTASTLEALHKSTLTGGAEGEGSEHILKEVVGKVPPYPEGAEPKEEEVWRQWVGELRQLRDRPDLWADVAWRAAGRAQTMQNR